MTRSLLVADVQTSATTLPEEGKQNPGQRAKTLTAALLLAGIGFLSQGCDFEVKQTSQDNEKTQQFQRQMVANSEQMLKSQHEQSRIFGEFAKKTDERFRTIEAIVEIQGKEISRLNAVIQTQNEDQKSLKLRIEMLENKNSNQKQIEAKKITEPAENEPEKIVPEKPIPGKPIVIPSRESPPNKQMGEITIESPYDKNTKIVFSYSTISDTVHLTCPTTGCRFTVTRCRK